MRSRVSRAVGAAVLLVTLAGCAELDLGAGNDERFAVEWTVEDRRPGVRRMTGFVYNRYGQTATRVTLTVEALDASNAVVTRRLEWVPGDIGPLGRRYFEVRNLPAADHYRVAVESYSFIESPGTDSFRIGIN